MSPSSKMKLYTRESSADICWGEHRACPRNNMVSETENKIHVRFEAVAEVSVKVSVFWGVAPSSVIDGY
jgi:hypothetical protein